MADYNTNHEKDPFNDDVEGQKTPKKLQRLQTTHLNGLPGLTRRDGSTNSPVEWESRTPSPISTFNEYDVSYTSTSTDHSANPSTLSNRSPPNHYAYRANGDASNTSRRPPVSNKVYKPPRRRKSSVRGKIKAGSASDFSNEALPAFFRKPPFYWDVIQRLRGSKIARYGLFLLLSVLVIYGLNYKWPRRKIPPKVMLSLNDIYTSTLSIYLFKM